MHKDEHQNARAHYGLRNHRYKLIYWYNSYLGQPDDLIAPDLHIKARYCRETTKPVRKANLEVFGLAQKLGPRKPQVLIIAHPVSTKDGIDTPITESTMII